jgi:hypothetical protein
MFDNILDAGADELENIGVAATHAIIQEVKEWV